MTSDIEKLEKRTDNIITITGNFADPAWYSEATAVVKILCKRDRDFTTDDAWELLDHTGLKTPEPRALGAIIRKLSKDGSILSTGQYKKSIRKECHRRPLAVWRPVRPRLYALPDDWDLIKAQASEDDNSRIAVVD